MSSLTCCDCVRARHRPRAGRARQDPKERSEISSRASPRQRSQVHKPWHGGAVMTSVVIQPIGDALDHYDRTVRQPVKFGDYGHLIEPTTLSELRRAFPSGEAAMWGVKPGA